MLISSNSVNGPYFRFASYVTSSPNKSFFHCIMNEKLKGVLLMAKRKAVVSIQECVACGCCIKVCPRNAITILKGIHASIDRELCVGCGKCAKECPASAITLEVAGQ